jgi:holin-like protein
MKLLRQVGIISGICFLGEMLHWLFKLPIPGNVLGMALLFTGLCSGLIKLEMIEEVSNFLLDHLTFFLIPAGVGIIAALDIVKGKWVAFIATCIITTVLIMIVTGHTIQLLQKGRRR